MSKQGKSQGDGEDRASGHEPTVTAARGGRTAAPLVDGGAETLAADRDSEREERATALFSGEVKRYALRGEHARGGLGRVLDAHDRSLDRPVVVKELLHHSADHERRFEREALITARLQHPSIVPVYDAGRQPDGQLFYAMKKVAGRSLADVTVDAETLDERLALIPKVLAVADAIAYAHSCKVIHRDLKPSNIMIGDFGETIVIDWGLAKRVSDPDDVQAEDGGGVPSSAPDQGLTLEGHVLGTPVYMPPEQARGNPVDERADVYSLGAVLYHVLTGEHPVSGGSAEEVLERVRSGVRARLKEIEPGVPDDLVTIVEKAMATSAADRYPDAAGLAIDLANFQAGQLVDAHRYSRTALVKRWLRRHRAAVSVAVVMALALAVGGALAVQRVLRERDRAEDLARKHRRAAYSTVLALEAAYGETVPTGEKADGIADPIPESIHKLIHAFDEYSRAVDDPNDPETAMMAFLKGRTYWSYEHYDRAIPILRDVLDKHADLELAVYSLNLLLDAYRKTGRTESLLELIGATLDRADFLRDKPELRERLRRLQRDVLEGRPPAE